ncbi:MAG: hypothetical protein KatS3mg044_0211 [Rhodothermaceae bacterium]|nr:MAG: hypothetical protein D6746_00525 [Bacteroidota bacterium]GIV61345.1 MAG: hypothetical protein KatS3mg044_0211 [Rhodothermaceae bacterium]
MTRGPTRWLLSGSGTACSAGCFVLLLCCVMTGCGRQFSALEEDTPPLSKTIQPGEIFELAPGTEIAIAGTSLRLRFAQVISDDRCPFGQSCPSLGSASILLETIDASNRSAHLGLSIPGKVQTPYLANALVRHRNLGFRLVALEPHPQVGQPPAAQADYRAAILIEP